MARAAADVPVRNQIGGSPVTRHRDHAGQVGAKTWSNLAAATMGSSKGSRCQSNSRRLERGRQVKPIRPKALPAATARRANEAQGGLPGDLEAGLAAHHQKHAQRPAVLCKTQPQRALPLLAHTLAAARHAQARPPTCQGWSGNARGVAVSCGRFSTCAGVPCQWRTRPPNT